MHLTLGAGEVRAVVYTVVAANKQERAVWTRESPGCTAAVMLDGVAFCREPELWR
jgi:hypothetical protein